MKKASSVTVDLMYMIMFFGGIVAGFLDKDGLAVFCAIIIAGSLIEEAIREIK